MSEEGAHYEGKCFCGAVKVVVTGDAAGAGYCHCGSCRSWSGGPVNAFTLWKAEQVRVTEGEEHLGTFAATPRSERQWCKRCGGHVMTRHPGWGLVDVFASTIPDFPFKPGVHVNYEASVLHLHDGLPKLADFPTELGGTGRTLPEGRTGSVKELLAVARAAVPDVSHADAAALIETGALVVDLREPHEIAASGKVRGAVHVPRGMLEFRADPELTAYHDPSFRRDRTVILYCASGGRAALAGRALKDLGYGDVRNLGGFKAWAEAGGAVEA